MVASTKEGTDSTYTVLSSYYSAKALAALGLRRLPRSEAGLRRLAQREGWPSREVEAKGGSQGIKTLYRPPPEILELIEAKRRHVERAAGFIAERRMAAPEASVVPQRDLARELGLVLVPRYDLRASGGGGASVSSEQIVDHLAFRAEWLGKEGLPAGSLALIEATGESMEPTIRRGDLLLVDLSRSRPDSDAIYVLRVDHHLIVKRLQCMLNGELHVKSDNPAYETQVLKPEGVSDLQVLGRVEWFGRRL